MYNLFYYYFKHLLIFLITRIVTYSYSNTCILLHWNVSRTEYLLCAWMSWQDDATAPKSSRDGSVPDGANGNGLMERDDGERRGDGRGAEVRPGAQAEDSKTQAEDPSDSQVSQGDPQMSKVTESKTSTSKVKKQQRTQCPYGSSCYRYGTAGLKNLEWTVAI